MPDFSLENGCPVPVAGVDEVGRGPLAGPVAAAAVIIPAEACIRVASLGLDDSKRLKPMERERLSGALKSLVPFGIGWAEVEEIDQLNILRAALLAMRRAVEALPEYPACALVDGTHAPELSCPVVTVVKGDRRSMSVAAASVLAKVSRDRRMAELARDWPDYGWERNSGYGVPRHLAALEKFGPTPHHRRSFAPVARVLAARQE